MAEVFGRVPRAAGGFSGGGFKPDNSDLYYLNRIRINLLIQPADWIKVFAQTQDARVAFKNTKPNAPPYQNTWDLRQAYLELGDSEKGIIGMRTGAPGAELRRAANDRQRGLRITPRSLLTRCARHSTPWSAVGEMLSPVHISARDRRRIRSITRRATICTACMAGSIR